MLETHWRDWYNISGIGFEGGFEMMLREKEGYIAIYNIYCREVGI
jgi:hypothetical protein